LCSPRRFDRRERKWSLSHRRRGFNVPMMT
jgi:hypothetical protein